MDAQDIQKYLRLLGAELDSQGITGEIILVGGAIMLLVIGNRQTTKDIDAYFASNRQQIRSAAQAIAQRERISPNWLNDAVKGFFYTQPPVSLWLDVPGLRVYAADPAYVLAMKAAAGRPEDIGDIQALGGTLAFDECAGSPEHRDTLYPSLTTHAEDGISCADPIPLIRSHRLLAFAARKRPHERQSFEERFF